jgi:hypothetical protein
MRAGELSTVQVGSDAGGFRLLGTTQASVRAEAWGYWPPDVATAFSREVPAITQKLAATTTFVLDANQLKPQGAEGQQAIRVLCHALGAARFAKATILCSNALTRMQLTRLLRECGVDQRVAFADSLGAG